MSQTVNVSRDVKFGAVLAKLLDEKHNGYTRKRLADELGVSAGMVSQYTTSKAQPTVEGLARIASLLDVSLDYLVFEASRAESWGQESRSTIKYMDVAISELRSEALRETAFVGRIATALGRVVHEHARNVADQVRHAAQGTILDDETLIIEQYSLQTRIISTDLQYDILQSVDHGEVAGRFLPVVAECVARGATYQFLLPKREDRDWGEVAATYRRLLRGMIGPDLLANVAFRQTSEQVFVGYGEYKLDTRRFAEEDPVLYEAVLGWLHNGSLAYTIGPSSEFSGDALMDESHFSNATKAFSAMWKNAKPISGEPPTLS